MEKTATHILQRYEHYHISFCGFSRNGPHQVSDCLDVHSLVSLSLGFADRSLKYVTQCEMHSNLKS